MVSKILCRIVGIKFFTYEGVTIEDGTYIVYKLWGKIRRRRNKQPAKFGEDVVN